MLAHYARTSAANPVVGGRDGHDTSAFGALRAWLARRPHTEQCRCIDCRAARAGLREVA